MSQNSGVGLHKFHCTCISQIHIEFLVFLGLNIRQTLDKQLVPDGRLVGQGREHENRTNGGTRYIGNYFPFFG